MDMMRELRIGESARLLGGRVRTFRKLNRLTVQQVAERAGLSRGTVTRLEAGDAGVSLSSTLSVCRALGILDLLLDGVDPYRTAIGQAQAERTLPKRVRN